jgi:CheY-like chemotaxis protein
MRRILVVGDDLHIGQAVRIWPKHHGFRVSTADGGTSGLAALDNATLDLMIADVFTPSMRGLEAIRLFHERAPTMPLVAISGYAFADMEISAPEFLRLATRPGALPAKAFQAGDLARCDRRMPVRSRVASPPCHRACRGGGRASKIEIARRHGRCVA